MPDSSENIAALIGSRICHDLISPVGAVANGLELLELSGVPKGPELSLATQSAGSAAARLRFFRLAFGVADAEARLSVADLTAIVAATYAESRTKVELRAEGALPRPQVKAALLALLCAEEALTVGGPITIDRNVRGEWRVAVRAERLSPDRALWAILDGAAPPDPVRADAVQFILLPRELARQNRKPIAQLAEKEAAITF